MDETGESPMIDYDKPLSKDEMIAAIVDQVQYWDLDTLIGWVEAEITNQLEELNYKQVYNEYTFYFDED
jgi:hypothetical protein